MREEVPQPIHLRRFFLADHDCLVSATPELLRPMVQSPCLTGYVGVEIVHELGELQSIIDAQEHVVVIG